MRTAKKNSTFYEVLPIVDIDGVSRVTGLNAGNFSTVFYFNGTAVTGGSVPSYSIVEIANGDYTFSATYVEVGLWTAVIQTTDTFGFVLQVDKVGVEIRNNDIDDVYQAFGGTGTKSLLATIKDSATDLAEVGVLINVWNSANTVFVTSGRSDVSGQYTFSLDPGTYSFRFYKAGFSVAQQEVTVSSSDSQTLAVSGTSVAISPPAAPNVCKIYADFMDQSGTAVENFVVSVTNLFDPTASEGLAVIEIEKEHKTNSAGHVEFSVVYGTRVRVSLVSTGVVREFVVPSTGVASLLTLLGDASDMFTVVTDTSDAFSIVGVV